METETLSAEITLSLHEKFRQMVQTGRSVFFEMGVGKLGARIEFGFAEEKKTPITDEIYHVGEQNVGDYHQAILGVAAQYNAHALIASSPKGLGGRFNLLTPEDIQQCGEELAKCDNSCLVYVMQVSPPRHSRR